MEDRLLALMHRFANTDANDERFRLIGQLLDFVGAFYSGFFALIGLVWLIAIADLNILIDNWELCLFVVTVSYLFSQFSFFIFIRFADQGHANFSGSLASVLLSAAIWVLGPTALLLSIALVIISQFRILRWHYRHRTHLSLQTWNKVRNFSDSIATTTFFSLIPLQIYTALGETFPVNKLSVGAMLPAMAISVIWAASTLLVFAPIYIAVLYSPTLHTQLSRSERLVIIWQTLFTGVEETILIIFGVLGAALYSIAGFGIFAFYISGFMIVALVTNRFSHATEQNRKRSLELERLENLSNTLLAASPDGTDLPAILEQHVPRLVDNARLEVQLFQANIIARSHPKADWVADAEVWSWLGKNPSAHVIKIGDRIPWLATPISTQYGIVVMPILDRDGQKLLGGVVCQLLPYGVDITPKPQTAMPVVLGLARQLETALHSAKVYQETLELQKAAQELEIAGKIQSSFLPTEIPSISGWDIGATILPARQTSGDFYDFIHFDNGNIGILVADVADKGTGAALYMALSRTLIRTYAMQYPDNPEKALQAANERILSDTKSDQFVTVFYAVLKPDSGELIYANAGHNPAIVICKDSAPQMLTKTGVPLGMFEGLKWKHETAQLSRGDILVLYTDGASEAQNTTHDEFGEKRLVDIATENFGNTAADIQNAILEAIQVFVGDAPQFDDITLMIAIHQ